MVESLLLGYAEDLNDAEPGHEFALWTREQLLRYHNEGLCTIAQLRPDLFTKTVVIPVAPCTEVQQVCDCQTITKVYGQATEDGRVIKKLTQRSQKSTAVWTGKKCLSSRALELQAYSIDKKSNKLMLYPPLHPAAKVWVSVECVTAPEQLTLSGGNNTRCDLQAAITQWVLYRAKSIDESALNLQSEAGRHLELFFKLIDAENQAASIMKKETSEA